MKFLQENKYKLLGRLVLVLVFVISVNVRKDDLKTELARHHEWITAHSLITFEVWDENGGPSQFGFNPVYSYPETFTFGRIPMSGLSDEKGHHYYVSYPPFSFYLGYYVTKLLGGPTVDNIRFLNLLIHFLCGFLIFLIMDEVRSRDGWYKFNFGGIIAASIYLLSVGSLWAHGMLYFVDTVEQLFFLLCIYLFIRFVKNEKTHPKGLYGLLFLSFFVASYTEWLGVFLAFITGMVFLGLYFIQKKKKYLFAFLGIGLVSSLAVGITIYQYSSIAGYDNLVACMDKKYSERSGEVTDNPNLQFHKDNEETFQMLRRGIDKQYITAENMIGAVGIGAFITFLIPVCRKKIGNYKMIGTLFILIVFPILMHYYFFYNFNALHDFSSVKAGLLMSLVVGFLLHFILTGMPTTQFKIGVAVVVCLLFVFKIIPETQRYRERFPIENAYQNKIDFAKEVRTQSDKTVALFLNIPYHPQIQYYTKQDYFTTADSSEFFELIGGWNVDEAQYFHLDETGMRYSMFAVKENDSVRVTDRRTYSE